MALGATKDEQALPALVEALRDQHLDVRKGAAQALSAWAAHPEAKVALTSALTDLDAHVRAYARPHLSWGPFCRFTRSCFTMR
jgi:HEAT repeat protein